MGVVTHKQTPNQPNPLLSFGSSYLLEMLTWSRNSGEEKKLLRNCSETALKIVREKVVSVEAQTPTNDATITVPQRTLTLVNVC